MAYKYDPILIANFVITFTLLWIALNHFEVVKYNPIDHATEEFQRFVHYNQLDGSVMPSPEMLQSVPEIIVNRGYPLEIHSVTTEDGYVLELHRIPAKNSTKSKPVFLQHGIFATSFVWTTGANNNSLAYVLADQGYDVWLGNSRGNTYSRKHLTLDPSDEKFWDFSWDEIGQYDIPASVDYILKLTGHEKLSYVGYSLGCATFFIGANLKPELNKKIEVMIGLGPTVTIQKLDNFFRFIAPLNTPLKYVMQWTKTGLLLPSDGLSSRFLRYICNSSQTGSAFCQVFNFFVFGYSEKTNISMVHTMAGHYPGGSSPKTMFQFFENYNSGGNFTRYNYGEAGNVERYGSPKAPHYRLDLVTAPVYLFYGQTDAVATAQDVSWLAAKLGNFKGSIRVDSPIFSHGDFFMSTDVGQLVYRPLLKLLPANA